MSPLSRNGEGEGKEERSYDVDCYLTQLFNGSILKLNLQKGGDRMKKIFSLFCVLSMLLGILCVGGITVALAEDDDGIMYSTSAGEATIVNYTGTATELVIPDTLGGCIVTTIGNYAFLECTSLESVTIPDSVNQILYGAFSGCTSLQSVYIASNVNVIAECVFENCTALSDITMEGVVDRIGYGVFADTAYYKNEDNWVDGVLYIGSHLIRAKETLSGVYAVREGTKMIASAAFANCAGLTDVTLPDSLTLIGEKAFLNTALYNDESNRIDQALYIDNHLIKVFGTDNEVFAIRNGTKTVAPLALSGCRCTQVYIPRSVEWISYGAMPYYGKQSYVYYGGDAEEWQDVTIETDVILWYKNHNTGAVDNSYIYFVTAIMQYDTTTHTVSYNANGGEGAPAAQTKIPGTPLTLSATVPTREGYTFLGWATNANATNAVYQPGDAFKNNTNTTLYAVWEADVIDEPVLGDLSGDGAIDMRDAFALYVAMSGGGNLTDAQKAAADMNGDGMFDMRDAFALYKIASGG